MINYKHAIGLEPGDILESNVIVSEQSMIVAVDTTVDIALYASIDRDLFYLLSSYPNPTKSIAWEKPYPWLAIYLWTTTAPNTVTSQTIEAQAGTTFFEKLSVSWHTRF
tara:strand:+ start:64 stop:390 length:327 start_codon:yes stop_codon:yes gene_type:complete